MKVLVFTSLYPNNVLPNHGVFIKERMVRVAALDGVEIKVIAPVPYFPSVRMNWRWQYSRVARVEVRDGIEVHHPRYFMTPKVGMTLYGLFMFLSVWSAVSRVKKGFDFDVIDGHYLYPDGFAAVLLGWLFKRPVVVSARGSDVNLYRTLPLIRALLRYVLRKADGIIAVSHALKEAMSQLGIPAARICCIPNGVDTEKFYPTAKEAARRQLGLKGRTLFLSVGNLTPNKGFDLLIRAFSTVAARMQGEDLHLAIVGEGLFRRELETAISELKLEDRVHLVGPMAHEKLHLWYSAADVFCLASEREGWPNVVLESLACGTPVVATPAGGIPEIISSEALGLLAERDEAKFADAMHAALRKTWMTEPLLNHARNHSWNHAAADVLSVFQSAMRSRGMQQTVNAAIRA